MDLSPSDLHYLMQGSKLRYLDDIQSELEYEMYRSKMKATDKNGKPKYKQMKHIFDYEKEVKRVMNENVHIKVNDETVEAFARSKNYAEEILNRRFKLEKKEEKA